MILIVMSYPVNTEHDEADNVREKARPQLDQFVSQVQSIHLRYGRDLDVEHHQGHRDGKDVVRQASIRVLLSPLIRFVSPTMCSVSEYTEMTAFISQIDIHRG